MPARRALSAVEAEHVVAMYKGGARYREIEAGVGCSTFVVRHTLRRYGVARRASHEERAALRGETLERAVAMYTAGASAYSIAREFGVGIDAARAAMQRRGVLRGERRPRAWTDAEICEIGRLYDRGKSCKAIADIYRADTHAVSRILQSTGRTIRKALPVQVRSPHKANGDYLAIRLPPGDPFLPMAQATGDILEHRLVTLANATETLRGASDRAAACRALLGDVGLDTLAAELKALGTDATAGLRRDEQQLSREAQSARNLASKAASDRTLADERTRYSKSALDAAVIARDAALTAFPEGVDAALVSARSALAASVVEKEKIAAEFTSLEKTIEERKKRIDAALSGARADAAEATTAVETAQRALTTAKTDHASVHGGLIELRKRRDAENLAAAEARLQEAKERHAAQPVPDRIVTEDEVSAARKATAGLKADLEGIEFGIQRAHGALEQVGGAVARERLRDATEAFELAERQERETEAEYEAWRLLLDQMKEADAAQASNLGQALVPAVAGRFQELTQQRYQTVQLTAQLATDGIMVAGAVRPTALISVGTREQLSTLYRLSLAEYLGSTIVLDDQLVQSDGNRMDWFRTLLTEKAHSFQIVVFTCRPSDYLLPSALVPQGSAVHVDTDGGFIRAVDLERALRRR